MQLGVFQLLQAKRDQIEAGRTYVETLTEYWLSRTDLEHALGGELPASPSRPSTAPGTETEAPAKHGHMHHGGH
jgi:cobalt-zinc-cadmium efflux system outer membrane protein